HFDHAQFGAHGDVIARLTAQRHDPTGDRRGHLHYRLVGGDFHHGLVFAARIADLDVPVDELGAYPAFAPVAQLDDVPPHQASMVAFRAAATRAWTGKYSHSNACG